MTRDEAIEQVLEGMQYLILRSATSCAAEQYNPHLTPDDSEAHIGEQKEFMKEVRRLRQEFEDTVTGVL